MSPRRRSLGCDSVGTLLHRLTHTSELSVMGVDHAIRLVNVALCGRVSGCHAPARSGRGDPDRQGDGRRMPASVKRIHAFGLQVPS